MTNKVRVNLTLSWEISKSEWQEGKEHWDTVIKEKIEYDPVSMFSLISVS